MKPPSCTPICQGLSNNIKIMVSTNKLPSVKIGYFQLNEGFEV